MTDIHKDNAYDIEVVSHRHVVGIITLASIHVNNYTSQM